MHPDPRTRAVLGVLLALAPVVTVALTPWHALTGTLLLAMLPALAAVPSGLRAVAASCLVTPVVGAVAVLAGTSAAAPLLGTALVVGLGLATAAVTRHGLHPVGATVIMLAANLLTDPNRVIDTLGTRAAPLGVAALVAALALVGSVWVLGVARLLAPPADPPPGARPDLAYGALLATLCGAFTLACLLWFAGTNAWWTVMTVALVLRPTGDDTRGRVAGRVVGTVVGATGAAVAAIFVPDAVALLLLGVLAAVVGVGALLSSASYRVYSALVTASVVLLTYEPARVLVGDAERVVATLVAAGAVTVGVAAASAFDRWRHRVRA